jgi:hypothetical protein
MHKLLITSAIVLTSISANSQECKTSKADKNCKEVHAYARGNDSYLKLRDGGYDAAKKYLVVKLWNAANPLTEAEKSEISYLKNNLNSTNIEVLDFEWTSEQQLKDKLQPYNIAVQASNKNIINLKTQTISLNTTSPKALLVVENDKPLMLCSGKGCESRLKQFFKLESFD